MPAFGARSTRSGRDFSPFQPPILLPLDVADLLRRKFEEQEEHLSTLIEDPDVEDIEDLPFLYDDLEDLPILPDDVEDVPAGLDLDIDLNYAPSTPTSAPTSVRETHPPRVAKHRRPYVTDLNLTPLERDRQKKHHRNRRHRDITSRSTSAGYVDKCVKAVTKRKLAAAAPLTTTYVPAAFVWTGKRTLWDRTRYGLGDMQRLGFTIVHWNGRCVLSHLMKFSQVDLALRDAIPILDNQRRCIAALLGQPYGNDWKVNVHDKIYEAMTASAKKCTFTDKQKDHRRGTYRCLGIGISFGGGQQRPGNLRNGVKNRAQLDGLLNLECFKRLAGFIDSE